MTAGFELTRFHTRLRAHSAYAAQTLLCAPATVCAQTTGSQLSLLAKLSHMLVKTAQRRLQHPAHSNCETSHVPARTSHEGKALLRKQQICESPISKIHNKTAPVILNERDPERSSARGW